MFSTEIVSIISSKYNYRLVIREESDGIELDMKNLRNKRAKP